MLTAILTAAVLLTSPAGATYEPDAPPATDSPMCSPEVGVVENCWEPPVEVPAPPVAEVPPVVTAPAPVPPPVAVPAPRPSTPRPAAPDTAAAEVLTGTDGGLITEPANPFSLDNVIREVIERLARALSVIF